jgi:hypothetical protein
MKIAICIPTHRQAEAKFLVHLSRLLIHTAQATLNGVRAAMAIEVFSYSSSVLPLSRTKLWQDAVGWGADYLFWMDADHTFPPDTLLRLLQRQKAVVAVNCPRRDETAAPTARGISGPIYTTAGAAQADLLEVATRVGFALNLVDLRKVVPALKAKFGENYLPLFSMIGRPDGSFVGEDTSFCNRLTEAGVEIHVDHATSQYVGHIHEIVLTNADSVDPRRLLLQTKEGGINAGSIQPSPRDQ